MNSNINIFIASDHAGFNAKEFLKTHLTGLGYLVTDLGNKVFDEKDDYPDFIYLAAKAVAENADSFGIIIGGSGQGEAIVANRVKGVRAAIIYDEYSARLSRQHNDANVASFGARTMDNEKMKNLLTIWLNTPFSQEERHVRRIEKINNIAS